MEAARRWARLLGSSDDSKPVESGYLFCPQCQARRPAVLHQVRRRFHVCFVPVHTREGMFYLCEGCGSEFPAEDGHGYDFTDRPEPSTWSCFKCGGAAPGHLFTCPQCGFSLNRTLESLHREDAHG